MLNIDRRTIRSRDSRSHAVLIRLTALVLAATPGVSKAAIASGSGDRWNTLIYTPDGSLSNGLGDNFFAGNTAVFEPRRGLLRFDIASMVPAGSTITSVSLRVTLTRTISGPELVTVHRVESNWGQGTSAGGLGGGGGGPSTPDSATWLHTFWDQQTWTNPGGDFDPVQSSAKLIGGNGDYTYSGSGLVSDVQAWANDPASNFGWLFKGNEDGISTAKRFASPNNEELSSRPLLTIEYTPVPGAPVAVVGCLSVAAGVRHRRRAMP